MQVDVAVGRADQLAEGVGNAHGHRAVGVAGADARQVEAVLRGAGAAQESRLVDDRHEGEAAAKLIAGGALEMGDQAADGDHRLELVAMHSPGDQQVGPGTGALDDGPLQFDRGAHGSCQRLGLMPGASDAMPGGLFPPSGIQMRPLRSPIRRRTCGDSLATSTSSQGAIGSDGPAQVGR